ncbi:MAG TPA: sodium:solute symporter family protein [Candidatus Marinimicrobia bacterium]|nr:sodium:solute symporter family protein [Candidatus Neomarinimicrobiota bacterium]
MNTLIPTTGLFWGILICYVFFVLGAGLFFARNNKSTEDFFFGGRRFSWWLIAMSMLATGVGSHSFAKYASKGFEYGFSSTMTYMNDWFFMPLLLFGWIPIIYYMKVNSIPEYFQRRFNSTVRNLSTFTMLLYLIGYIGIGLLALGSLLQPILGWEINTIIIVVAVISGIYVSLGGQTAIIFTDFLQGIILLFAGLLIFGLGIAYLGGFDSFWNNLSITNKLPLADFNSPPDFNFAGIFWQDGIVGSVGFAFMNQAVIMRFLAARSVVHARRATIINVLVLLPIATVAVSNSGWIARAITNTSPDIIAETTNPNGIFTVVAGIVSGSEAIFAFLVAAVVAALMSSLDSQINASAAVAVNDIYTPLSKNPSEKTRLRVAMVTSLLVTFIGIQAAFLFSKYGTIYEAHGAFHSVVTPPMVTVIFLGIFWKRFSSRAAVLTFVVGAIFILLGIEYPKTFVQPFSHGIEFVEAQPWSYIRALYNVFVCVSIGIIVTLFTKPPKNYDRIKGLTIWTIRDGPQYFKGSDVNKNAGITIQFSGSEVEVTQKDNNEVSLPKNYMDKIKGNKGDLIYISDHRWYLGGLKSTHARLGSVSDNNKVTVSKDVFDHAQFNLSKDLIIELEV